MAYEESLKSVSLDADASLATYTGVPNQPGSADPNIGHQYKFVKVTARHTVGLVTTSGGGAIGVMQNKPQVTGQAATVGIFGISTVRSGAAVTVGGPVMSDTTGRAVDATTGKVILGIAIEGCSNADELISVLLIPTPTPVA